MTQIQIPHSIHAILARCVRETPYAEAAVEGDVRLSYAALGDRVDAFAKGLLAAGVAKGDRVALLAPPGLHFWVCYLATVSIGAIWFGLNPRYQRNEYSYLLESAAPKIVFAVSPFEERRYVAELQELGPDVRLFVAIGEPSGRAQSLEAFLVAGESVTRVALDAARQAVEREDIAVIVYTSGTTGKPKGAMLSHRAIASIALTNAAWMGDGLASTVNPAPINHVGGLNNVSMNVLAYGGRIIFHPRVDIAAIAAINARERPTYMVASPTAFQMMLSNPAFDLKAIDFIKLIVFGGAVTPQNVVEAFMKLGAKMSCVYGQTETCGIVTATQFDDGAAIMAETIGRALPGAEVRVATEDGAPVPAGATGEIQVKAPFVMSGYYNNPEATKEAFTADGFLKTGDLGVLRPDGNIAFAGRLKEMFKSGGYNVYPLEVEQAIAEHGDVAQVVVAPRPHPVFQEVGHAIVQARPGSSIDIDALRAFLKARIADYKVPKTFEVVEAMPYLPNAKIDRAALKKRAMEEKR